jgi:hypothetical protein
MRGLRYLSGLVLSVALVACGALVSSLLAANSRWLTLQVPEPAAAMIGDAPIEVHLAGLLGAAAAGALAVLALVSWSLYYLWRKRQYEVLVGRLERELVRLRNLPFTHPAPLEDLPETTDPVREGQRDVLETVGGEGTGW